MSVTFLFPLVFLLMIFVGLIGLLINRDNILRLVVSLELILLGVNAALIFCSLIYAPNLLSQFFVILVLSVAAAEAAIALALLVVAYKRTGSIKFSSFNTLRG